MEYARSFYRASRRLVSWDGLRRLSLPLSGQEQPEVPLYDPADLDADMKTVARKGLAEQLAPLALTTKMPCPAWGISAFRCRIGNVLADVEGSTCEKCYARKGRFKFSNVQARLEKAYQGLFNPLWTPALAHQVLWHADRYFRLFHSGDLQGENHLRNLVTVAQAVPDVSFWLPTREAKTVRAVLKEIGAFPENLVVRVSGAMIDGPPPKGFSTTSTVVSDPEEVTCPAPDQGNSCADCRDCWRADVRNVAYNRH